jgi:hypothetical protein
MPDPGAPYSPSVHGSAAAAVGTAGCSCRWGRESWVRHPLPVWRDLMHGACTPGHTISCGHKLVLGSTAGSTHAQSCAPCHGRPRGKQLVLCTGEPGSTPLECAAMTVWAMAPGRRYTQRRETCVSVPCGQAWITALACSKATRQSFQTKPENTYGS